LVGNHGSVVGSYFYTKIKKLDVQEGKKDKPELFADHVTQVCKAHKLDVQEGEKNKLFADHVTQVCEAHKCEEIEKGTHAHRASKLRPIER